MLIAQLSDTHIKPEGRLAYGQVDTTACLRQALARLHTLPQRPDVLLITGDLVDAGSPEEYDRLHGLLRQGLQGLDLPCLLVPGNHDSTAAMRQAFADQPGARAPGAWWQFAVRHEGWPLRIVGLDTVLPGDSGGLLCETRLQWLHDTLAAEPDTPVLLALHHPPFDTGIGHMDDIGLQGREGLAQVLARHPQVQLVVCGHLHRCIRATVAGRPVMTAPSTAHAVQLDLARTAEPMFRLEPPGFLLHWWDGQGLVTHQAFAETFDGPYPFFDEAGQLKL